MAQLGQVLLILGLVASAGGLGVLGAGTPGGAGRWSQAESVKPGGWAAVGRLAVGRLAEVGRGAAVAAAACTTAAAGLLLYALVTSDFSLRYVAQHTGRAIPLAYKVSAFWAGQEGSLLLWAWVLSLYAAYVAVFVWRREAELCHPALAVLLGIQSFFMVLLVFVTPPFSPLSPMPADGVGLNPMLQNPGMFFHPVALYLGYVGFAVPFAFGVASLLVDGVDGRWLELSRPWTLWSWLFLSVGIILGMQWAYVELGWGGYWSWDPVENASLLPWLTGTAFLHTALVQERRGLMRGWSVVLAAATFWLTVLGTFITRSGVLSSVHAFTNSGLGVYFLEFLLLVFIFSAILVWYRFPRLRDRERVESAFSREGAVVLADLVLLGFALVVLWGTLFPLVSRSFGGVEVAVGPGFFVRAAVPFGGATVALLGLCPALGWRRASWPAFRRGLVWPLVAGVGLGGVACGVEVARGGFSPGATFGLLAAGLAVGGTSAQLVGDLRSRRRSTGEGLPVAAGVLLERNPRRYGGFLVHLAIAMIVIGFSGSAFRQETTVDLRPGHEAQVGPYTLSYQGLEASHLPYRVGVYARIEVRRQDKTLGVLRPEQQYYPQWGLFSEVAVLGGWKEDLYTILEGWQPDGTATLRVMREPLVAWIWAGGYVLAAGTVLAAWRGRR